jgi:hypothetical protein
MKVGYMCRRKQVGTTYSDKIDYRDDTIVVDKVVRTREDGREDVKYRITYNDRLNETTSRELFEHVPPPWLMLSKDEEDFTEQLHPYISKGNVITLSFLTRVFGSGKWTYLNSKTFFEGDFPSSGITIK